MAKDGIRIPVDSTAVDVDIAMRMMAACVAQIISEFFAFIALDGVLLTIGNGVRVSHRVAKTTSS